MGWGPWKVIPTFITGALFGYLYIKVGLHAAIAMHFLFDYDGFIYDLLDYPYIQLYAVYYFALLFGGFFLAWILVRFKGWILHRSGRVFDRKWILVAHSILVVFLVLYITISNGLTDYAIVLSAVPFLNGGALIFKRVDVKIVPEIMVLFSSLISLALAPLGMMWLLDDKIHFNMDREHVRMSR
jgi:hypothetical protein